MLSEFYGMKVDGNIGTLRNRFNSITVSQLQKKLEALTGEKVTKNSKDQLHHLLYEVVIPDEDKPSGAKDANAGSKKKEICAGIGGTGSASWLKLQGRFII